MKQGKLILVVSILASFVAFLDGSIVNVGLPAIVHELGGGLAAQQWVVDAYLLTLSALILLAGSLSDLLGRRKILTIGLIGFGVASVLCALAPNITTLIIARALQGVAGALLVPSSLALIMATFNGPEEGRAIGIWTGWTGIAFVVGPLLGGFLVDAASWRLMFAINVVPIVLTLLLMRMLAHQEEPRRVTPIDLRGAILGALGLGGPVYALIEQPYFGWVHPLIYIPMLLGLLCLFMFVWHERHSRYPMLPLGLFKERNFAVGNLATVAIYAALSIATFLIAVFVQQVGGYSALQSGLALLPVPLLMLILSSRFGALAGKFGPHFFMAVGPLICAAGFLLMMQVNESVSYWPQLFPGSMLFGVGLSMTVAPLTAAVLGSISTHHSGIASAVNNAIARLAGLLAIAMIGVITGPQLTVNGFRQGMLVTALLLIVGGVISAVGITNNRRAQEGIAHSRSN